MSKRKTLPAQAMQAWLEARIKSDRQTAENILNIKHTFSSPESAQKHANEWRQSAHIYSLVLEQVKTWQDAEPNHIFNYYGHRDRYS